MNIARIVLGGVVAGVIIDVLETVIHGVFFRARWEDVLRDLDRELPRMPGVILIWIVGLVFGIMVAWLYAAIRPRYGVGPKTAVVAGLYLWVVAGLLIWVGFSPLHLWPTSLMLIGIVANLIEYVIAGLVAGYLYKEAAAA